MVRLLNSTMMTMNRNKLNKISEKKNEVRSSRIYLLLYNPAQPNPTKSNELNPIKNENFFFFFKRRTIKRCLFFYSFFTIPCITIKLIKTIVLFVYFNFKVIEHFD